MSSAVIAKAPVTDFPLTNSVDMLAQAMVAAQPFVQNPESTTVPSLNLSQIFKPSPSPLWKSAKPSGFGIVWELRGCTM